MTHEQDQNEKNLPTEHLTIKPEPFASSDVSIAGIEEFSLDTLHRDTIVLREKVILVGDATVGKTAIAKAFRSKGQIYAKEYLMTAGVDFNVAEVVPISTNTNTTNNTIVDLFLYDMGGQSIFNQREMPTKFWSDCQYIVCVFDVSSRKSLQNCRTWIDAVRSARQQVGETFTVLLVANKIDLRENVS